MNNTSNEQDDWEKKHNNYVAETIIQLGPELCNEYMQRNYTERHSHSKVATAIGSVMGNSAAWVHDAFYTSMHKARELVQNNKVDPQIKSRLETTLKKYYWVEANQK